ncbi:OTU-like cysteine protease [Hirsutella rhossiliensis]|uniref:OTU-like cysteine protease domain-containing protein n=1 Tax=Hirsutella rhossiliensis TaxID=111463 RepID=A0A9P8MQY7_9HYPO|nr:OTU-like cysteine protease domain-containing protein [Hirsutella rhossiliensis]KAH0959467.1 OTU-like cysteine protease domain-containing protein [Hirsutella rhossiliensis]
MMEQQSQAEAEQMQARHRKELKELQGRITSKKKNATKKSRKGVNDECAQMEQQLRDKQAAEIAALTGAENDERQQDDGDATQATTDLAELELQVNDKLSEATSKLHLSEPMAKQKPRNRQRERLARRAAEQEEAARRAEDEATSMTDHRARESEYMRNAFEAHGLVERDIDPDGHCLFSAIADQLGQSAVPIADARSDDGDRKEPAYKTVRRAAADYMLQHADDFAPFLDEDLESYAAKMRDTAEWGGQLELMALARRYCAEIRVIQDGRTERIGEDEGKASGKTLWLAYYRHGYGLGEHYNSLRHKTKP